MRRVVLALLMMAVLLPSAAFARVVYLCSMDGKVRSSCCCPTKTKAREAPPVTTIKGACCCEVSTVSPTKPPAIDPPKANAHAHPELVAVVTPASFVMPRRPVATFAPRANAPPDNPARSLFSSHCSLLL